MYAPSLLLLLGLFGTFTIDFLYCFNKCHIGSSIYLVIWALAFCLAVMGVALICLLFLLILLPVL